MQGGRAWGAPNSDLPITSFMGRKLIGPNSLTIAAWIAIGSCYALSLQGCARSSNEYIRFARNPRATNSMVRCPRVPNWKELESQAQVPAGLLILRALPTQWVPRSFSGNGAGKDR
jgi:hypothetical protein